MKDGRKSWWTVNSLMSILTNIKESNYLWHHPRCRGFFDIWIEKVDTRTSLYIFVSFKLQTRDRWSKVQRDNVFSFYNLSRMQPHTIAILEYIKNILFESIFIHPCYLFTPWQVEGQGQMDSDFTVLLGRWLCRESESGYFSPSFSNWHRTSISPFHIFEAAMGIFLASLGILKLVSKEGREPFLNINLPPLVLLLTSSLYKAINNQG